PNTINNRVIAVMIPLTVAAATIAPELPQTNSDNRAVTTYAAPIESLADRPRTTISTNTTTIGDKANKVYIVPMKKTPWLAKRCQKRHFFFSKRDDPTQSGTIPAVITFSYSQKPCIDFQKATKKRLPMEAVFNTCCSETRNSTATRFI